MAQVRRESKHSTHKGPNNNQNQGSKQHQCIKSVARLSTERGSRNTPRAGGRTTNVAGIGNVSRQLATLDKP